MGISLWNLLLSLAHVLVCRYIERVLLRTMMMMEMILKHNRVASWRHGWESVEDEGGMWLKTGQCNQIGLQLKTEINSLFHSFPLSAIRFWTGHGALLSVWCVMCTGMWVGVEWQWSIKIWFLTGISYSQIVLLAASHVLFDFPAVIGCLPTQAVGPITTTLMIACDKDGIDGSVAICDSRRAWG